jgi:putative SOS response-associated peptidase YedK
MCSRFSLSSPHDAVRSMLDARNSHIFPPRYNIAPTQPVLVARLSERRERELVLMRWGLIPSWMKDPARVSVLMNARSETAADKPSFRGALRHRRCIVPADAFYEWRGEKGHRRPYMVRRKDRGLFAFAGLWECWLGADGSEIDTMAILTVRSNEALSWLHDRMPAILEPEAFKPWLDTRTIMAEAAIGLLRPFANDALDVIEIEPTINNPQVDGPELQTPAATSRLL